jgi:hypothetical protein
MRVAYSGIRLAAFLLSKFHALEANMYSEGGAAMSERSESNGASGTPVELATALLSEFCGFLAKTSPFFLVSGPLSR